MIRPRMDVHIQAALNELDALGWWYQHFQLPNRLWTGDGSAPSYFPQRRWEMIEPFIPADLTGKTALDLGGNAGYFSIQMKLRGAARCVLVDPFHEFLPQAEFAASQFHVEIDLVCEDAHTYCLTTEERFDYVLLLGLLYHGMAKLWSVQRPFSKRAYPLGAAHHTSPSGPILIFGPNRAAAWMRLVTYPLKTEYDGTSPWRIQRSPFGATAVLFV